MADKERCTSNDEISLAEQVVLMNSQAVEQGTSEIRGYDFNQGINYERIFDTYLTTGIQATHLANVVEVNYL